MREWWGKKGTKRTWAREANSRFWEEEQSSGSSYQNLHVICSARVFFLDKPNFMISTTAPVSKKTLIRFKKKNIIRGGQRIPANIISSLPTASFWRILSTAFEFEHKQGAFAFRLAGRRELLEHLEVERRLDGEWHKQSVFVLRVSKAAEHSGTMRRKMFLYR